MLVATVQIRETPTESRNSVGFREIPHSEFVGIVCRFRGKNKLTERKIPAELVQSEFREHPKTGIRTSLKSKEFI
jgi:hypothetical protein